MSIAVVAVERDQRDLPRPKLAQPRGEKSQVLSPVIIGVHQNILRVFAGKFVEVGQVVGMVEGDGNRHPADKRDRQHFTSQSITILLQKFLQPDSRDDG